MKIQRILTKESNFNCGYGVRHLKDREGRISLFMINELPCDLKVGLLGLNETYMVLFFETIANQNGYIKMFAF